MPHRIINLWTSPPDRELQQFERIQLYARRERLPWRRQRHAPNEELRAWRWRRQGRRSRRA